MVTPQEQGITEIRTPSALPECLIKQGGSAFRKMKCLWYNGTKGIPFSEMHCHHILLYNITSKYGKKIWQCFMAVENLQCKKGTEQEGQGRAPNHQD
jgi:hypothetical protein